jgi:hypothetical protein
MSNIFKTSSRFDSLSENYKQTRQTINNNIGNKSEVNYFKNTVDYNKPRENKRFGETFIERYNRERDEQLKEKLKAQQEEKERLEAEALSPNSFPELSQNNKLEPNNEVASFTYMDKLKTKEEIKEVIVDPDLVYLKDGWVLYKKDDQTGKTLTKRTNIIENNNTNDNTEQQIDSNIVNALIHLHQKKTDDFIQDYGYEEWETTFKCPDWREFDADIAELEAMNNSTDEDEDKDNQEYFE